MKITLGFLLLVLMSYTEGKSIKQDLTSSQTDKEDLRLKRSVFGIVPKRRMEIIANGKGIKTFHKQNQKARLAKMHIKKHLNLRIRRGELCSIMTISLKQLCHKINWYI